MSPTGTRWYLVVLMAGLLLQGLGSLLFRLDPAMERSSPYVLRGALGIDVAHSWIHILWGAAGLVVLLVYRSPRAAVTLALVFGVFYTAFGILGVLTHHPLGLELDAFENTFHLTAGPLTLVVGLLGLRRLGRAPSDTTGHIRS